jgi:ATP-binding cassette subfamily B protein
LEVSKPYRPYLFGMLLAMVGVAAYTNFQGYFIKLMVDAVVGNAYESVIRIAIWYGLLQLCLVFVWALYDVFAGKAEPMKTEITKQILDRVKNYDIMFFQNNLGGSLSSKIKDASTLIPSLVYLSIDNYFQLILIIVIAAVLLANTHWVFSVALIIWVILFLTVFFKNMQTVRNLSSATAESDAKIWGKIVDYLGNILSVKYFASHQYEATTLAKVQDEYNGRVYLKRQFLTEFYFFLGLAFSIYIIGCMAFLIYLYGNHLITPGDFVFVFSINYKIIDQLFTATHSLRDFVTHWGTVDQALTILDTVPEIQDKPDATVLKLTWGEIIFDKVKFNYKNTESLFQNKSVTIAPGQKIGLVGYSGSGKSSFVNLILRLYDVEQGAVLIDGQDIRDVTQDSLRRAIGMIPQDPSLFHRSLMENIRYGRIDATDKETIDAAKYAHAHEFISKLPQGYDSLVGERGVKLSGGERQRIAIARVFLKNASILILDEATSQLDSVTESHIQESLWKLMQGKTTIVIAHRLSTLLRMDRILVFNRGKIVEDGTHPELLAQNGLYKTLWDAQVGGFLPALQAPAP